MNKYLNTIWQKQPYPPEKKYFLWKCSELEAKLYTDKSVKRGVIQDGQMLWKVVVSQIDDGLKIVGIYPRHETSGHKTIDWIGKSRKGAIPREDIVWIDDTLNWEY